MRMSRRRLMVALAAVGGVAAGVPLAGFALPRLAPGTGARWHGRILDAGDFGTVGDGVADDTGALSRALDAAAQRATRETPTALVLRPGRYRLTRPVRHASFVTIVAHGAYVFRGGQSELLLSVPNSEGLRLIGGIWDGRGQEPDAGAWTLLDYTRVKDLVVQGAVFRNTPSYHALEIKAVDGGLIDECRFEGFVDHTGVRPYSEAVQLDRTDDDLTHSRGITITRCHVGPAVDGSGLGSFGTGFGSHSGSDRGYYDDVVIAGNVVEGCLREGIRLYDYRRALIADNTVRGAGEAGILARTSNPGDTNPNDAMGPTRSEDVVITRNVIERCGRGVRLLGFRGGSGESRLHRARVTGNTVSGTRLTGVAVRYVTDCVISGNTVADSGEHGVLCELATGATRVDGNEIRESAASGVVIASTRDARVTGNQIIGAGAHGILLTTEPGRPIRPRGSVVTGNGVRDTADDPVRSTGSGNTITDNTLA